MDLDHKICPVCASAMTARFTQQVLHRHEVTYFQCPNCGLLQTETPHWLDEAYSSPIATEDTGILVRNASIARKLSALIHLCFDPEAVYLDSAGGYGLLTRMMRDAGFDFYWHDDYCQNLFAAGFERESMPCIPAAVTAFEVLEHVEDPISFLSDALDTTTNHTVILSTELFQGPAPRPDDWWYYVPETGQHISFYQRPTLEEIARRLSVRLYSNNDLHVFTSQPLDARRFRAATGRASWPISLWLRSRMTSKTFSDHDRTSQHERSV
jgi:hypothetical protein